MANKFSPGSLNVLFFLSQSVHVLCVTHRCYFSPLPSIHQPGAWRDSLGTDVNKLCLRKSQTQNVCEHNCTQSHVSLLVFFQEMMEKSIFPWHIVTKMNTITGIFFKAGAAICIKHNMLCRVLC